VNGLLREYPEAIPKRLNVHQRSVLGLMGMCRTGLLGYLHRRCLHCQQGEIRPQSCGDRHCPQCLGMRQAKWADTLSRKLPAVPHFHVVFTLPSELGKVIRRNKSVMLSLFFDAVAETMSTFFSSNWNSQGGFIAVLHTWGQTLNWHPHIHLLVPGGGFDLATGKWKASRSNYLFPLKALSPVFRAIFLRRMSEASAAGKIDWPATLHSEASRDRLFRTLASTDWVLFIRHTLKHTRSVVRYLARYTSRIGIHNRRLRQINEEKGELTFAYTDYRNGGKVPREMTLSLHNFFARFAQHILPKGLKRIRRYGFLSPASRFRADIPVPDEEDAPDAAGEFAHQPCSSCGHSNWTKPRRFAYPVHQISRNREGDSKAFPSLLTPQIIRGPTSR